MKKMFLMCAAAAAMALTSCVKEKLTTPPVDASGVAYLSIKVDARSGTRASDEDAGVGESDLKTLYLVTFDATGKVIAVPGGTACYSFVDAAAQTDPKAPDPVKISSASKNLMIVANPGDKLRAAVTGLTPSSTFASFNEAIAGVETSEITTTATGFAMITAGDEANPVGDKVLYPYVTIGDYIQVVAGAIDENTAIANAKAKRLPVKLERLAAKLVVMAKSTIAAPDDAEVKLTDWTVDAVNTTFYPFAEKTLLGNNHTAGDYTRNFYTQDPNFTSDPLTGYAADLKYVEVVNYAPVLLFGGTWKTPGTAADPARIAYVIENTMAAAEQKVGSSTRIIMKATYFPEFQTGSGYTDGGDWFSWAGKNYPTLAALQSAYSATGATSALKDACDRFLKRVKTVNSAITTDDFTLLTQAQLDAIDNGGQVVKEGKDPVIKWYQDSRCYYSYEIRHDDAATATMAFAKYGVVRNNWYDLTLNSVKGPGTPWYPESEKPGPGDPDPKDPIDTQAGYLGVSVDVNDWIIWRSDMNDVD